MFCTNCGVENQETAKFCKSCGAVIQKSTSVDLEKVTDETIEPGPRKRKKNKGLFIIVSLIVLLMIIGTGTYGYLKISKLPPKNLASELAKMTSTEEIIGALETELTEVEAQFEASEYALVADRIATLKKTTEDLIEKYQYTPDEPEDIGKELTKVLEKTNAFIDENALILIKGAYEKEALEVSYSLFKQIMITDENKDEFIPIMADVLTFKKEYNRVNQLIKMLMTPYSVEALNTVSALNSTLDEKYPNRDRGWSEVVIEAYDIAESFKDGVAKVGVYKGLDASGLTQYSWGLINTEGEQIVAPKYDLIGEFLEGRAAVKLNNKWGFIDESGNEVISLIYDDIKDPIDAAFFAYAKRDPEKIYKGFYGGFAPVKQGEVWGFVDSEGQVLNPGIIFKEVLIFSEGSAVVRLGNKYGLLGSDGRYIHQPDTSNVDGVNFDIVRPIFEGLAGVNWNNRKDRGLINTDGKLVAYFDKEYIDLVQDFREGLASVRKINDNGKAQWGFINPNGNIVIPTVYDSVTVFIDGIAKVEKDGKFGLINRSGNLVTSISYNDISAFSNGYAIVTQNNMQGVVGLSGQLVIEPIYEKINGFVNGVSGFKKEGKWGILNEVGEVVVTPMFDDLRTFNHGVAPVLLDDKWGFIDITGCFVIAPQFEDAQPFEDGLATIRKAGKFSYISLTNVPSNLSGQVVDEKNQPVVEAEVDVYEVGFKDVIMTTQTNENGEFKTILPAGKYYVSIHKDHFMPVDSYIDLSQGYDTFTSKIVTVADETNETAEAKFMVENALDGSGLNDVEVKFRKGYNNHEGAYLIIDSEEIIAQTDDNGLLTIELPVGAYTAETYLDGFTPTYINVTASSKIMEQSNQIRSMPVTEKLSEGETRITLEWGETPSDLDAHLIGPKDGEYGQFHVYYPVLGTLVHNTMLDKDDTSGNGFETTTIYKQTDGRYVFDVFDYSNQENYNSNQMSLSGARVRVYQGDQLMATFDIPTNRTGIMWEVFAIEGNRIIPINNVTNHLDNEFYTY